MYIVPFGTDPISGAPRFQTGAPRRMGQLQNIPWNEHRCLVVGYTRSVSCWSNNCACDLGIWQVSFDQLSGRLPSLGAVCHNWWYLKRYPPDTYKAHLDSHWADPLSLEWCQKDWWGIGFCGWNCAVPTPECWHNWSWLEMELYWRIPQTDDPHLVSWVEEYPDQVIVAPVSYGSHPLCEIPKVAPMGHSTLQPLNYSGDQPLCSEILDKYNIDVLHTLGINPIQNRFGQYPLCNVRQLCQPDELHRLLLDLVKDLLHRLPN